MPTQTAPHRPDAPWPADWLRPELGVGVGALMSTRQSGISAAPYASCNLGDHVGDDPLAVAHNRHHLAEMAGAIPTWLTQVHGNRVLRLRAGMRGQPGDAAQGGDPAWQGDGAVTTEPGLVCTVMVADCLPILLAAPQARGVAALHAGWRGLAGAGDMQGQGIAEAGVAALCEATSSDPAELRAWLGPCIGPTAFEVGADVLQGFGLDPRQPHPRFMPVPLTQARKPAEAIPPAEPKWLADLPGLARDRLMALGLKPAAIEGGTWCTVSAPSRFFSFRRAHRTGRQAACIWLKPR